MSMFVSHPSWALTECDFSSLLSFPPFLLSFILYFPVLFPFPKFPQAFRGAAFK